MRSLQSRTIIVVLLLGFAAAVSALSLYPIKMQRGAQKAGRLPLELGSWSGEDYPVEDYVKSILETDDIVQRHYTSPLYGSNLPIMMAVVFSADNRRVAHPPEVCYRGSGWEVTEKKIVRPDGVPEMVRLILQAGINHKDMVFYCYKAGEQLTANYYRQQYNIVSNQIRRVATSSAMIRFSSPVVDNEEATEKRLVDFMRLMMPQIQEKLGE